MNIQVFINQLVDKSPTNIRSQIYKKGILSSYNDNDSRMVFYSSKNQRFTNSNLLKLECNGLVLDTNTLEPLVIPPVLCKSNVNTDVINKHLNNDLYDIISIDDGTVINLYHWNSKWYISTARSYDLTHKKWGTLTYKEVVKSILGDNEEKFYDILDKSRCYTFGVKHENIHPFREDNNAPINKIWFIQSVSLETKEISIKFENDLNILESKYSSFQTKNVKDLFPLLKKSLNDFMYKTKNTEVNYGFILRSKDHKKTGENSNILLESSLLQNIRNLYYHSNFNKISQEMNYDRDTYTLIYSYLDINRHSLFKILFPQYLSSFKTLETITNDLIIAISSFGSNKPKNKNFKINNISKTYKIKISIYAETLYRLISSYYIIAPNDNNLHKIISSYLLNERWVDIYYKLYIECISK
jgi:hypothetical protein